MGETVTNDISTGGDPGDAFETNRIDALVSRVWYEPRGSTYWHADASGERWVPKKENQLRRWLTLEGLKPRLDKEDIAEKRVLSEVDELLAEVETNRILAWAGIISGWAAGVHVMRGQRILNIEQVKPLLPLPAPADAPHLDLSKLDSERAADSVIGTARGWPILALYLRGLLSADVNDVDGELIKEKCDQRIYFLMWLRRALQSLVDLRPLRGHAILIAGEPKCGKSLLIDIIAHLMGGRLARPLDWIQGRTAFNSDLYKVPLLVCDDDGAKTHIADRKELGARVKQVVAVPGGTMQAKQKESLELEPFWRLIMATNLEENNLLVFPPVDDDLRDKVLIFKGFTARFPWSVESSESVIWGALEPELPHFVHWLLHEFDPPQEFFSQRFGVVEYHHPEILQKIDFLSPEMRLWGWIERTILQDNSTTWEGTPLGKGHWKGEAVDIEKYLKGAESGLTFKEREKVPVANPTIGKYLSLLATRPAFAGRITQHRTATRRLWILKSEEVYKTEKMHAAGEQSKLL